MPGITSPICFINGLGRCVSKILSGIPPYGSGAWAWFSVSEAQQSDKAITAATNGDNPSRVCPPRGAERVAGEGIKNTVEMLDDHLSDCRNARNVLRRSDASDLCHLPGENPSRVCLLRVERVAGEGIPHDFETRHSSRGWKTCTDCSPLTRRLGTLPSPR